MDKLAIISAMNFTSNSAGSKRVLSYCNAVSSRVDAIYLISLYSIIRNKGFAFQNVNKNIFSSQEPINNKRTSKNLKNFIYSLNTFLKENTNSKIILYPSSYFIFDLLVIFLLHMRSIDFYIELNEVRKYNLNSYKSKVGKIRTLLSYLIYSMMDFWYKSSKGHIYISSTIAKYYNKKNSVLIPILCNSKNSPNKNFKLYNNSELFTIGFAGTIDPAKEKMETFFKSIKRITSVHPNILVNMYGIIPHEESFIKELEKYGINNFFKYNGLVKQERLIEKLKSENHLLILPRGFTKQNYYGFSTKLSEYLEAQLPILTSTVGDIGNYFANMKNSFTYTPDNVDSLTERLEFILNNYNSISPDIIKGGDELVNDTFHYSNYSDKLYSFLFSKKI